MKDEPDQVDQDEEVAEGTDYNKLAETRTRAVLTSLRRFRALRKDGDHSYSPEQVAAMIGAIDRDWERTKGEWKEPAFKLATE